MILILAHPQEANKTCKDCSTYVYDKDGSLVLDRETKGPLLRKRSQKPACLTCPKCRGCNEQSPEVGRKSDLSRKNQRTLQLYYEHQACPGEVTDLILRRNFGIIHQQFENYKLALQRALLSVPRM